MVAKYLFSLSLLLSSAIALPVLPIQSATAGIVRQIEAYMVSGETAQLQNVKVWNGHGVSISFYRTGEVIKKIWLDDPSKFVIDVDGCLEGLGKCSSEESGAGLIHLRRIETVKIPGLPQASYGSHLPVITELGGNKKSYHFKIIPGSGKPEYSQLEIIGDSSNNREPEKRSSDYTAVSDSKYIVKGMQVALDKQWINSNTPLWERLTKLVELRRTGEELTIAATNTGVSMKLVEKLMLMGGKGLLEMPPPKPVETNNTQPTPENLVVEK